MSSRDDIYSFLGSPYYVGLSSIFGITIIAGQIGTIVKHGGGGTLWCGGSSVGVGTGYLMTTGEALNTNANCTMYFAGAGSTCTLYVLYGRSAGFNP